MARLQQQGATAMTEASTVLLAEIEDESFPVLSVEDMILDLIEMGMITVEERHD
jgi:hypothetical protein